MTISLIIPCYNEFANIQKGVLDKIGNFTKGDARFIEVSIIDDGSTDDSKRIIKQYLNQFPKFRLIENKHQGKAYAINTGIRSARGEFVFFTDMDLATPIEETEKLIKEIKHGYQIVVGSRKSKREGAPFLRKVLSFGAQLARFFLFNFKGITDTQCGFKLFEKKAAILIVNKSLLFQKNTDILGPSVTAAFDLEFLFLAFKMRYKIKEVPVHWQHMETRNVNFMRDTIETLQDLFKIKYYEAMGKYK